MIERVQKEERIAYVKIYRQRPEVKKLKIQVAEHELEKHEDFDSLNLK